jgi:hypothetical protein
MTMAFRNSNNCLPRTTRVGTYLLAVVGVLLFALAISPGKAQAQILGKIEANIPFPFHVGDARFPAGKYVVHMLEDTDPSVMEISSADDSMSALFQVEAARANSAPAKTELIFNKYGKSYFLAKLFDEGSTEGRRVVGSHYEKKISKEMTATEEHVAASHRKQQGD